MQRHVIEHTHPLRTQGGAAGVKPLLVFLNTRSGPQVGSALRRKFLRLLNPIQVCSLSISWLCFGTPHAPPLPSVTSFLTATILKPTSALHRVLDVV